MQLIHGLLENEAFVVQLPEHVLGDGGLLFRGGATKVVEGNAKPLVDRLVNRVVFVANLLWRQTWNGKTRS